jgi:hypothetical protein
MFLAARACKIGGGSPYLLKSLHRWRDIIPLHLHVPLLANLVSTALPAREHVSEQSKLKAGAHDILYLQQPQTLPATRWFVPLMLLSICAILPLNVVSLVVVDQSIYVARQQQRLIRTPVVVATAFLVLAYR